MGIQKHLGAIVVVVLVVLIVGCPRFRGVTVTKDVSYGLGYVTRTEGNDEWVLKPLFMDIYEPDDRDGTLLPAIVLVHGGSFMYGSKEDDEIVEFAEYFARRGFVAFTLNYRLEDTGPPAPDYWDSFSLTSAVHAACVDVRVALRHIYAHADEYGVDSEKIALLGASAGAIASIAAIVADDGRFESDGDDFPVPPENNPDAPHTVGAYLHFWGGADHVLHNIDRNTPPIMIVHGREDTMFFASYGAARRLRAMLRLVGVPYEWRIADTGHGVWNYRSRGRSLKHLSHSFVVEHLGL